MNLLRNDYNVFLNNTAAAATWNTDERLLIDVEEREWKNRSSTKKAAEFLSANLAVSAIAAKNNCCWGCSGSVTVREGGGQSRWRRLDFSYRHRYNYPTTRLASSFVVAIQQKKNNPLNFSTREVNEKVFNISKEEKWRAMAKRRKKSFQAFHNALSSLCENLKGFRANFLPPTPTSTTTTRNIMKW